MVKIFFLKIFVFFSFIHLQGVTCVYTLGSILFSKKNFLRFFKHCFCLLKFCLWCKFQLNVIIFQHIWESKVPKPLRYSTCINADMVPKTLKTFNLATTNDILMKLTTIVYLYKILGQNSSYKCESVTGRALSFIKMSHKNGSVEANQAYLGSFEVIWAHLR